MLAYLFWHRPRDPAGAAAYEQAHVAFHRSLARTPPVGMRGSAAFRLGEIPWLGGGEAAGGYEDWYLLADFTALGVLNEAAVGRGHRTSHDRIARRVGASAGGVYCRVEGEWHPVAHEPGAASPATWVSRPSGASQRGLGDLLGDGMDPLSASLWRRQLVLGPAPEFCLLAEEPSAGVAPERLPVGWTARTLQRELLFGG